MGVPCAELPAWHDLQILTAQFARTPLDGGTPVDTQHTAGPDGKNPLHLEIPIFVSNMSFGALSEVATVAISDTGYSTD